MRFYKTSVIATIALSLIIIAWESFAADTKFDCGLIVEDKIAASTIAPNWYWYNGLYDNQTIWTALQHLADYCCIQWYINASRWICKWSEERVWWAESPYLFDHLINIWFRKLDAYTDANLRYNLPADSRWTEWQQELQKFNKPSNLATPESIINVYNSDKFWRTTNWQNTDNPWFIIDASCNDAKNRYDQLSLYDRYKASCEIAKCLSNTTTFAWANSSKTSINLLQESPEICETIYSNRKNTETLSVNQLATRAWIRTITSIVEQYTKNYFVWTRWQNLYEQRTSFDQWLTFVNRKVQEGTPVCSK